MNSYKINITIKHFIGQIIYLFIARSQSQYMFNQLFSIIKHNNHFIILLQINKVIKKSRGIQEIIIYMNKDQNKFNKSTPRSKLNLSRLLSESRKLILQQKNNKIGQTQNEVVKKLKRSWMFKQYKSKLTKFDLNQVIDLAERNTQIPKLQAIINYGRHVVLPEIIQNNPQSNQSKNQQKSKIKTVPIEYQSDQDSYEKDLLQQQEKSYNKKEYSILVQQQQILQSTGNKLRTQGQYLNNRKVNSRIRKSLKSNSKDSKIANLKIKRILSTAKTIMDENYPQINKIEMQTIIKDEQLNKIESNYSEVYKNNFPPVILSLLVKKIEENQRERIREMQKEAVKQQKFDTLKDVKRKIEDQKFRYKLRIKSVTKNRKSRKRDSIID